MALRRQISSGVIGGLVLGLGLVANPVFAAPVTATNQAVTNGSATDTDFDQLGDGVGFSGFAPPTGSASNYARAAIHIFELPTVADPFTDITAAELNGVLYQNSLSDFGGTFNMDMVFMGITATNPGVLPSDYETSINQAINSVDVAYDNWATPSTPIAPTYLPTVDILSYVQNNYIPGGFLKIGLPADQMPAVGTDYLGRYRVRGQTSDPFALTITYDDGAPPPTPVLADYDFNTDLNPTQTGVTDFVSVDGSTDSTASNIESGLYVLDSSGGVPAPSLFHGDPIWLVESEADALTQGAYIGFDVTPDPGKALDLEELSFDLQQDVAGEGLGSWAVYGDLDPSDGLDDFVKLAEGVNTAAGLSGVATSYEHISVDLSDTQYQGLDGVALRLYRWHDGPYPLNAEPKARTDNLVLKGAVVPEPASLVLIGLGALACMKRRLN